MGGLTQPFRGITLLVYVDLNLLPGQDITSLCVNPFFPGPQSEICSKAKQISVQQDRVAPRDWNAGQIHPDGKKVHRKDLEHGKSQESRSRGRVSAWTPGERRGTQGQEVEVLHSFQKCLGQHEGYWIFLVFGSYWDTMTVQAPQPPLPQPYLVPVRWTGRKGVKEKRDPGYFAFYTFLPQILVTSESFSGVS